MAQQYPTNTMPPEVRLISDTIRAAHEAEGINEIKLRQKYRIGGKAKKSKDKGGGNSGKTGKKFRHEQRMHSSGKVPYEQKLRSEAQSRAYQEWRSTWMTGNAGPQPG